jgi:hypothetical protein
MRKITKRSLAITTAAVVAVGGGAAAWAAWSVSNSATASVQAGSASQVQIEGAVLNGPLVPGAGTGVTFTVKNTNPFRVKVTGVTATGFTTTKAACANSNFQAGSGTVPEFELDAQDGANATRTIIWNNAIKLKADPSNECQNAPVQFKVNVEAASLDS